MSNTEMIRDLRAITQAGMKDCKEALEESNWNLQKAVDIIKAKGKNIASNAKVAAEGRVCVNMVGNEQTLAMAEFNCVTDFTANSKEFNDFCAVAMGSLCAYALDNTIWDPSKCDDVESARQNLTSITKENVIIRRWWVEQVFQDNGIVFSYLHPSANNGKIGVVLTMLAPTKELKFNSDFQELGADLAMQVAAMSPLAVSPEKLDAEVVARQKAIFEKQIVALNKPAAAQEKIMEGKMEKWYSEVCLMNQYSVKNPSPTSKITIGNLVKNIGNRLGGEIQVINFVRCQVGDGLDKPVDNFADEALKMTGCFS